MPSVEFTSTDLEALSQKLANLEGSLSERERTLLLGAFALAGERLAKSQPARRGRVVAAAKPVVFQFDADSATLPTLAEGFRNSFVPGVVRKNWAVDQDVDVAVMIGVMF